MRIENSVALGVYVRERRRSLRLTQEVLAKRARVSRRWLSDLEAGKETAEVGMVLRTLCTLDVVLDAQPMERLAPISLDDLLAGYERNRP